MHGVTVTKTYTFHRGSYPIGLEYQMQNAAAGALEFAPYAQILRNNKPVARSYFHPESYAYKGPAYDDGKKYREARDRQGSANARSRRSTAAGWPPCSTISSPRSCRRRARPGITS